MMTFKDKVLLTTLLEQAKTLGVSYIKVFEQGIKGKNQSIRELLDKLCTNYGCDVVLEYLIIKKFISYAKAKEFETLIHQHLDVVDNHGKASK